MPEPPATADGTTIGTNVLLALTVFACALMLVRTAPASPLRRLWVATLSIVGAIAVTGTAAHAARAAGAEVAAYWRPSYLVLGWASSLILLGAVGAWLGYGAARPLFAPLLAAPVAYFAATWRMPHDELVLDIFAAVTVGSALAILAWLGTARARRTPGAALAAAGLALLFPAAAVQLGMRGTAHVIWTFDHNGIAHLIAALAVAVLAAGLRTMLRPHAPRTAR